MNQYLTTNNQWDCCGVPNTAWNMPTSSLSVWLLCYRSRTNLALTSKLFINVSVFYSLCKEWKIKHFVFIITIKIELKMFLCNVTVISLAYGLHTRLADGQKNCFYVSFLQTTSTVKESNLIIVLGYFKSRVGQQSPMDFGVCMEVSVLAVEMRRE